MGFRMAQAQNFKYYEVDRDLRLSPSQPHLGSEGGTNTMKYQPGVTELGIS